MGIESTYTANDNVPSDERNRLPAGTYFCYECNKMQIVNHSGILKHCPKCGSSQFYQQ